MNYQPLHYDIGIIGPGYNKLNLSNLEGGITVGNKYQNFNNFINSLFDHFKSKVKGFAKNSESFEIVNKGSDGIIIRFYFNRKPFMLKIGDVPQPELDILRIKNLNKFGVTPKVSFTFTTSHKIAMRLTNSGRPYYVQLNGFVSEYAQGLTLRDFIKTHGYLDLAIMKSITLKLMMFHVITGCAHGDLHWGNIMVVEHTKRNNTVNFNGGFYTNNGKSFDIKLIDFGRTVKCNLKFVHEGPINIQQKFRIVRDHIAITTSLNELKKVYSHFINDKLIAQQIRTPLIYKTKNQREKELGKFYEQTNINRFGTLRMDNFEQMFEGQAGFVGNYYKP